MPFQKGNKLGTGRPKGLKNRDTLLKEERRAIFDAKISEKWEQVIEKLKPEYVADQFLGKAPAELIVRGPIQIDSDIAKKNEIAPSPKNNSERQTQI